MQEKQLFMLMIFAVPIGLMSWILWRVTIELGFPDTHNQRKQLRNAMIKVRPAKRIEYSNVRSSRWDSYSR